MRLKSMVVLGVLAGSLSLLYAQGAPTGGAVNPSKKQQKALEELKGKVDGKIVWATSRVNSNHDIWIMDADGADKKALTTSPGNVDWFSRFSPNGSRVLFVRSKAGWVKEMDAKYYDKWDIWMINTDGTDEKKVVESGCWSTWRPDGETIIFARGAKVYTKNLSSGEEKMIFDAEEKIKKGAIAQQPEMSPDGKLLAMTVRGSERQTGIYNLETGEWHTTGGGCQINFWPSSNKVLRMNEGHGKGGTEVLCIDINENGKPTQPIRGLRVPKEIQFMDLPLRRSHEYFPRIDPSENWLVWTATQYGHDHDIYDYEVFIWDINTNKKKDFVRLTFHSGNDRWPDIHTGEIGAAPASTEEETESQAVSDEEMSEDSESESMDENTDDGADESGSEE
ncbi:MAG: hypothetical protein GF401_20395 [Chitinivibrionales bacterium]|nr:hypothetical protein [Chitinivibrionales bacterium]